jgi:tetratricopeptide (TPR) repeat protein
LTHPYNQHWITYYRGVMSRVADTSAWDEAHEIDQMLNNQFDLPMALRTRVTTDLGRYYYQISGEYDQAIAMLNESLRLRRDLGDEQGQAHVLSHLAVAQSAAGDFDAGRASGLACVRLAQRLNAPYRLGWGYYSLGVIESRASRHAAAVDYLHQSLEAFETAGYEFEPGIVHYQLGHVALARGNPGVALEHLRINIQLMQKYEKLVLVARTMVDICEIHLAYENHAALVAQAKEVERLILTQDNHTQLARLRLVQAEMILAPVLRPHPASQQAEQDEACAELAMVESVADCYLDALLAAAQASRTMPLSTVESVEKHLELLNVQGHLSLVRAIVKAVLSGVDQALEGALARQGRLAVLSASGSQSLVALELGQRWASAGYVS